MKTTTTATKDPLKRQRSRTKYTDAQILFLERVFQQTQYPDSPMLEELSVKLEVAAERLSIWFQNRRSKFKRQSKDGHVMWMRKQIFHREDPRDLPSPYMTETGAWDKNQCHVLSPPSTSPEHQLRQDVTWGKPSSNLNYMPLMSAQLVQSPHQLADLQVSSSPHANSTPSPVPSDPSPNLMPSSHGSRSTTSPTDMDMGTFHFKKTQDLFFSQLMKDSAGCHGLDAGHNPVASPLYPTYSGYNHASQPPPYPSSVSTSPESKRSSPNGPSPKPFSIPASSNAYTNNWMIHGSQQSPVTSSSIYGQFTFPQSDTVQNSQSKYPVDLVPNWSTGGE